MRRLEKMLCKQTRKETIYNGFFFGVLLNLMTLGLMLLFEEYGGEIFQSVSQFIEKRITSRNPFFKQELSINHN